MAKTVDALQKEIQQVASPYLQQVRELEHQAQQKRRTLEGIRQEASEKEQRLIELDQEAQAALKRGEDPRGLLQEASKIRSELESLQSFIGQSEQVDSEEQQRIVELRDDLAVAVRDAIKGSKAKEAQTKALVEAMRQLVAVHDGWQEAIKTVCSDLGLDENLVSPQLLELQEGTEESELATRIRLITVKNPFT